MKRITFVDKNKGLVTKVKKLFDTHSSNKRGIVLETHCGDIIEYKKKNGGLIATASNPSFTMGGGLDAVLDRNFCTDHPKEFSWTDDLFWTITVDSDFGSSSKIIERALIGCFSYAEKDITISGFGTGIGGLPEEIFLDVLRNVCVADLKEANLRGADLKEADLRGANLRGANLREADLRGADLRGANLRGADLRGADLRGADLRGANLRGANLREADLRGADLRGANLRGADLRGADLRGAEVNHLTSGYHMQCPEVGSFIGWKKVGSCIIKLRVPAKAKRSSATTRKCRAEYAKVLAIYGEGKIDSTINESYVSTEYKVGEYVYPDKWDPDRWNECSHGIHFFITRAEAEAR